MVIHHLLTGMILQEGQRYTSLKMKHSPWKMMVGSEYIPFGGPDPFFFGELLHFGDVPTFRRPISINISNFLVGAS